MDLLEEYIKSGRIKLNTHKYHEAYTVHDPCNYVRKSQMAFGQSTGDKIPLDRPAVHRPQPLPGNVRRLDEQPVLRGRRRRLGHALRR